MAFGLRAKDKAALGGGGVRFLEHGLGAIERILPHTETFRWRVVHAGVTSTKWGSPARRELTVCVSLHENGPCIQGHVRRRTIPTSVGRIPRTLDLREKDVCSKIAKRISQVLAIEALHEGESLRAVTEAFDESIVSSHLEARHALQMDLSGLLGSIRRLSEQSYENKAVTFGCVIDPRNDESPDPTLRFPEAFLSGGKKRFRALSDGYHTAYIVSRRGRLIGFVELPRSPSGHRGRSYLPEWAGRVVQEAGSRGIAVCLTRNGDMLVLDGGNLRFTYRAGRWQYWNHTHLIDLLRKSAQGQRVPKQAVFGVVSGTYRDALDVSFRRSGGLFVILRNEQRLHELVRLGDAEGDPKRSPLDDEFRNALVGGRRRGRIRRAVTVELASLDGAIVLSNRGQILAYAAVLEPERRGRIAREEGSRTKAAIGASKYGLAIKISSDGDISAFFNGRKLISVG